MSRDAPLWLDTADRLEELSCMCSNDFSAPMIAAASELRRLRAKVAVLQSCGQALIRFMDDLPENGAGSINGLPFNHAYCAMVEALGIDGHSDLFWNGGA